jgi:predicted transcriptional regulator YdeE
MVSTLLSYNEVEDERKEDDSMETKFANKPSMNLIGVTARTMNTREMGPDGRIPKLWQDFFGKNLSHLQGVNQSGLTYVLYADYESDANGAYTVLIGHEWAADSAAPEGFETASVPAAKYVVFTTSKGVGQVVAEAWHHIWAWFENSSQVRTYTGDFEIYDMNGFDPNDTAIDIYIAIE